MRRPKSSLAITSLLFVALLYWGAIAPVASVFAAQSTAAESVFEILPYVQLGDAVDSTTLDMCWGTKAKGAFKLEYKQDGEENYRSAEPLEQSLYARPALRFFVCKLSSLKSDSEIDYKIVRDGNLVFEGSCKSRPSADKGFKAVLLGDIAGGADGVGTLLPKISGQHADLLVFTGDLVAPLGSSANYVQKFFPSLSGVKSSSGSLLSEMISVACPGDRDLSCDKYDPDHDNRRLDVNEGGMAFFSLWKLPLNGPGKPGEKNTPVATGSAVQVQELINHAGKSYPTSANYSFDFGLSHWLVLDGNAYVDWRDEKWQKWVRDDLAASSKKWKFVVMHQPGFSSDTSYGEEQRMRFLSPLFEQGGVSIVFSGHSNSYQRSMPMHFTVAESQDLDRESKLGFVYGKFKLDRNFDSDSKNRPDGVIYVISGGGGAEPRAERRIQDDMTRWQPFTKKFFCANNSFTVLDVQDTELVMKQVSEDGSVVDSVKIAR